MFDQARVLRHCRQKSQLPACKREVAVEFERLSEEVLCLCHGEFIPPLASERACGLMVAAPGIDILRTLTPDDGDFCLGERRLKFNYYPAGDFVLQLQRLGPGSLELAGPENAAGRAASRTSWVENADFVTRAPYTSPPIRSGPPVARRSPRSVFHGFGKAKDDAREIKKKPGTRASRAMTSFRQPIRQKFEPTIFRETDERSNRNRQPLGWWTDPLADTLDSVGVYTVTRLEHNSKCPHRTFDVF